MNTKLEALLTHVSQVKADDPTAKCLIFTQFKPTLDLVCKELPQHGFAFRTLTGDMSQQQREEALLSFRDDPPTTVFVLSIRAGAVGINLTEANHGENDETELIFRECFILSMQWYHFPLFFSFFFVFALTFSCYLQCFSWSRCSTQGSRSKPSAECIAWASAELSL